MVGRLGQSIFKIGGLVKCSWYAVDIVAASFSRIMGPGTLQKKFRNDLKDMTVSLKG